MDLFCGVGGLSYGLLLSGIEIKAGFDIDKNCKFGYEVNTGGRFVETDIANVQPDEVSSYYTGKHLRLLAGCPPCQPFSKYRNGQDIFNDSKWGMINEFLRIVEGILPEYLTFENVPELAKRNIFLNFVQRLRDIGYTVDYRIVRASEYGSAQNRRRLVLVASNISHISFEPQRNIKPSTVREKIGHLPPIGQGEQHPQIKLHKAAKMSALNLQRIKHSKQGGSWNDWPEELIAECHKKESGRNFHNVYGRMSWDKQSPTITTMCFGFGNGRFGHPDQDRGISMLEAALLQGFPESFLFFPEEAKTSIKHLSRMIGNAIPVEIGKAIGDNFVKDASKF